MSGAPGLLRKSGDQSDVLNIIRNWPNMGANSRVLRKYLQASIYVCILYFIIYLNLNSEEENMKIASAKSASLTSITEATVSQ